MVERFGTQKGVGGEAIQRSRRAPCCACAEQAQLALEETAQDARIREREVAVRAGLLV